MNIKDYFERICYKGSQDKIDLETLTEVFQHHIHAVPFENLSLHCGQTIQLDLESVYDKIVKHNHGGWCLENSQLLFWAFQIMGYKGAHVYDPERKAYYPNSTHLLIRVILEGKTYIVDGGLGVDYQMWQPMDPAKVSLPLYLLYILGEGQSPPSLTLESALIFWRLQSQHTTPRWSWPQLCIGRKTLSNSTAVCTGCRWTTTPYSPTLRSPEVVKVGHPCSTPTPALFFRVVFCPASS
uniref:arylamine N-acetyltransferase n=1 Tax=Pseudonaja textilis TaxID=8673 RepID=A0A670YMX8_PSETE